MLDDLLAQIPDGPLKDALLDEDPVLATSLARDYLAADTTARADLDAFFTSDGARIAREVRLEVTDGTPTSDDLARWLDTQD